MVRHVIAQLDGLQLAWLRDPSMDIVAQWKDFSTRFIVEDDETGKNPGQA